MKITMTVSEEEVRQAVCDYLKKSHKITINPVDLIAVFVEDKEDGYEDTVITKTQIGFKVHDVVVERIMAEKLK